MMKRKKKIAQGSVSSNENLNLKIINIVSMKIKFKIK